jgi:hypothetical protein
MGDLEVVVSESEKWDDDALQFNVSSIYQSFLYHLSKIVAFRHHDFSITDISTALFTEK